jgi:hypothetical protein
MLYGVGMCPVDGDSLACLKSRESGEVVLFCPICGLSFREPPEHWELNENLRLDELAPIGVTVASRQEVEAAGLIGIKELDDTWKRWVEEVLWKPPPSGESEAVATKVHFDRWYRGERMRPE